MPYLVDHKYADLKFKKYGSFMSIGSCVALFILVVTGVVLYYRHKEKKIKDGIIDYVKKEELYTVEDYLKKREIEREEDIHAINTYFEQQALTPQDKTMQFIKNNDPRDVEHFVDESVAQRMAYENRVPRN